ncbi:uncharacterized protein CANTADRAFT_24459 [Suhomyces tanzawaensis NRRL Y-17324]|uniref:GPI transamidase component GPI17 n=1 Tax=Suhomyces tanzawaensis NRRL Y-17324 TaxID=984487 RepID=A0A1E4SQ48_9ASCO|nr:uncharacterized protein CANTADRAFT_24459 [Suhomyces tanzawaensis NRRL Y-17324]ODV81557.1 hypothetical protein CANTADRAFT_24459 [Suhomyces tanzawaensis NRRL Y-17324]
MTSPATTTDSARSNVTFIRRTIVAIVFVMLVSLGYPLVMSTTTVYRAELPTQEVTTLANNFKHELHFRIPVFLDIPNGLEHFISSAQSSVDEYLYAKHPELKGFWGLDLQRLQGEKNEEEDYILRFDIIDKDANEDASESFFISPFSRATTLGLTTSLINANKVDEFLRIILLDEIFGQEIQQLSNLVLEAPHPSLQTDVVIPYSPKYNVVFTLLTENGKTIEWDIEKAIDLFQPAFHKLQHFTNFSINTQIQYYSKPSTEIAFNEEQNSYIITPESLSTFINFGDWNLITHDILPTINFLVFFPESNYDGIKTIIDKSSTNSFLVPQWGGVKILNKDMPILKDSTVSIHEDELLPIMEIFTSQLYQLLGAPEAPKSPNIRVDILSRIAFVKNIGKSLETLKSLIKLTESLNEISVPETTKNYVNLSLDAIKKSFAYLNNEQNYGLAMSLSADALKFSDKAFFEKEMVQQAYFPSEHKLAVFLPLLGPVGSIVFLGFLKVLLDRRKEKRDAVKREKTE